jgi:hypothetical protein
MFYSGEQLNGNEIVGWEIVLRDFLVDILRAHRAANEANGDKMDAKRPQL